MTEYVDGFLLPVPKDKIDAYRAIAEKAGKVWLEYGALAYRECVGDDLEIPGVVPLPRMADCKPDETVVFAWITYRSREHRDEVNAKVMADPRMKMAGDMPFDCKRMGYGGFKTIVQF